MRWSRFRSLSLRAQLLLLLLPAMLALISIELLATRYASIDAANAAYDRSVSGALRSLDANISTASGGLAIELPYRLFELYELTASGDVYFRVATADGLVEIGSPDLPLPPAALSPGTPVFYDASYFGQSLRLGAYMRKLDRAVADSEDRYVVIQVAENTLSRDQFTKHLVFRAALRDTGILLAAAACIFMITSYATRPVAALAEHIQTRNPSNLGPLNEASLSAEVSVLVRALNQLLDRTRRSLDQQRMFLDDASHQLRTPLATLRTQLDYARLAKDPAKIAETFVALARQVDHATHCTNQLLALARSDTAALRLEEFNCHELLRSVALRLVPLARSREIDFGMEVEGDIRMEGDSTLIQEAIFNLANNALRHTPPFSQVTLHGVATADEYVLSVVDSGPGLPEEIAAHAGERFIRGGRSDSVGLGLAIARAVADRHHGTLAFHKRDGNSGLVAEIRWPAYPANEVYT